MASTKLRGTNISDTFRGVLHAKGAPIPENGVETVYDGEGFSSALKIGRNKVIIDGELEVIGNLNFQDNGLDANSIKEIVDKIYPVGSVYLSINSVNPGVGLFTGTTWEQVAQGKFLAGVGTGTDKNNDTKAIVAGNDYLNNVAKAGAGEYNHQLTEDELALHGHPAHYSHDSGEQTDTNGYIALDNASGGSGKKIHNPNKDTTPGNTRQDNKNSNSIGGNGGDEPHNNTPPWFGVYMWQRTG